METSDQSSKFPHHRLDAYVLSMELARMARDLTANTPKGHRTVADHFLRSSAATVLLIAEGANRVHDGEKHHRYAEARGECGEAAAACELLLAFELIEPQQAQTYLQGAARLGAMLTGLINRFATCGPRTNSKKQKNDSPPE